MNHDELDAQWTWVTEVGEFGRASGFSTRDRVQTIMKASPMATGSARHEAGRTRRFPDIFTRAVSLASTFRPHINLSLIHI